MSLWFNLFLFHNQRANVVPCFFIMLSMTTITVGKFLTFPTSAEDPLKNKHVKSWIRNQCSCVLRTDIKHCMKCSIKHLTSLEKTSYLVSHVFHVYRINYFCAVFLNAWVTLIWFKTGNFFQFFLKENIKSSRLELVALD